MNASTTSPSIVLVHGGFVDGSGWQEVFNHLSSGGYKVSIVQNPTMTLADDVEFTNRVVSGLPGKVLLVGHSYGGVVITEAGTNSKVAGLVYVAAFAPDSGESVAKLIATPAPGAPVPPILPPQDGFLLLDPERFADAFAADVPHGGIASAVGRCSAFGRGVRPGLEGEAVLVRGCLRRPNDSAAGSTCHGSARGL